MAYRGLALPNAVQSALCSGDELVFSVGVPKTTMRVRRQGAVLFSYGQAQPRNETTLAEDILGNVSLRAIAKSIAFVAGLQADEEIQEGDNETVIVLR